MSADNQTFFVKARPDQIIGPLKLSAIEAMVSARKLEPNVEVSSDQIIWVPLKQIQGNYADFNAHPNSAVNGFDGKLELDAPLPGPLSDLRASQHQSQHDNFSPSGRIEPDAISEAGPSYNADLFDAPYPGQAAPLPGYNANQQAFYPGASGGPGAPPLPGQSAPLPGQNAPMPGSSSRSAPLPALNANYPGAAPGVNYPGQRTDMPGHVENPGFVPQTTPGGAATGGFGAVGGGFSGPNLGGGQGENPSYSATMTGRFAAPDDHRPAQPLQSNQSGSFEANQVGNRTFLGAPADPANRPPGTGEQQWDTFDKNLPYNVDDLFQGGGERPSQLFSTAEDNRGTTILGKAGVAKENQPNTTQFGRPDHSAPSPFGGAFTFDPNQSVGPGEAPNFTAPPQQFQEDRGLGYGLTGVNEGVPSRASYAGFRTEAPPKSVEDVAEEPPSQEELPPEKKQLPFVVVLGMIIGAFVLLMAGGLAVLLLVDPFGFNTVAQPAPVVETSEPAPTPTPPPAPPKEEIVEKTVDPVQEEIDALVAGPPEGTPFGLDFVVNDEYSDYLRFGKDANSRKDSNFILLSEALFKSRYGKAHDEPGATKRAAAISDASEGLETFARGAWEAANGAADAARTYLELFNANNDIQRYYAVAFGGVGDVIALSQYLDMKQKNRDAKRIEAYASSAKRTFEQAIKVDSQLPFAYFWLGRLAELRKDPQAALAAYNKVLLLQKYHAGAKARLAQLYVRNGEIERAKSEADMVINKMKGLTHPSELADALVAKGIVAILVSDYPNAITSLKEALELDPNNDAAYEILSKAFSLVDQNQEALHYFTTNENFKQDSANVMIAASIADTNVGRLKEARERLTEAEKKYPYDARIPYRIALSFEADSNYTGAQNALRRALDKNADYFDASIALARILWKGTQELERSDAIIRKLKPQKETFPFLAAFQLGNYYLDTNRFQIANDYFKSALKTAPEFLEARLKLASVLTAQKRYDEALNILNGAPNPNAPPIQVGIASILLVQGDVAGAKKIADTVLNNDPNYMPAIILSVRAAIAAKDFASAETLIKKTAKATGENYTEAYITKGLLAEAQGNVDNAKIIFESLIRFRPDAREVNYYLARNYLKTGNRTKALELYTRYINQSSYKVPVIQAYLERGDLYLLNLVLKGAESDFQHVLDDPLATDPQKVQALIGLAKVSMHNNKYTEAIERLNRSLAFNDQRAETYFDLGQSYANLGKPSEAVKAFNKAKELGFTERKLDKLRAYAYLEQGLNREAKEAFKEYIVTLDKNRDEGELKEVLQQLERLN